jgi:hypothetical protein
MVEPVSVILKFGFLAVLYLFLLWVARSAIRDLRREEASASEPAAAGPSEATGFHTLSAGQALLVVSRAPGHEPGSRYEVGDGATLGRGEVEIVLEDPFASSRHARLERQGGAMILEDLGSTNGTYLNDELLQGPAPLHDGDRVRIGDSEFVFTT